MKNILDLDDVVSKVNSVCLDGTVYRQHQQQGTLDNYYQQILESAVLDLATIPVTRSVKGLEPIEDPVEVSQTFSELASIVSIAFGKPFKRVQADLVNVLHEFPAHDYRQAITLRSRNELH